MKISAAVVNMCTCVLLLFFGSSFYFLSLFQGASKVLLICVISCNLSSIAFCPYIICLFLNTHTYMSPHWQEEGGHDLLLTPSCLLLFFLSLLNGSGGLCDKLELFNFLLVLLLFFYSLSYSPSLIYALLSHCCIYDWLLIGIIRYACANACLTYVNMSWHARSWEHLSYDRLHFGFPGRR